MPTRNFIGNSSFLHFFLFSGASSASRLRWIKASKGASRREDWESRVRERVERDPSAKDGRRGGADRGDRFSRISCESGVAPCAAALIRCQLPEPCATVRTAHNRHLLNDDVSKVATGPRAVSSSATSPSFSPLVTRSATDLTIDGVSERSERPAIIRTATIERMWSTVIRPLFAREIA